MQTNKLLALKMTENYSFPITPPPELVEQWAHLPADWNTAASLIAQWGADQELEACCEWIADWYGHGCNEVIDNLRTSRRPEPPSLKEQALQALAEADLGSTEAEWSQRFDTIRRALEQLDD
jgi:hypothetical protein